MRACLLMADIEQAEHGPTGRSREWLARAARAPRDPAWIADGQVFDHWMPISPISGRLDAFTWQQPPDLLGGPGLVLDDRFADEPAPEPAQTAIAPPVESVPVPQQEPPPAPAAPPGAEVVAAPVPPAPDAPREEQAIAVAAPTPGASPAGGGASLPNGADAPAPTKPEPDKAPAPPAPHDSGSDTEPVKRVTVRVSS